MYPKRKVGSQLHHISELRNFDTYIFLSFTHEIRTFMHTYMAKMMILTYLTHTALRKDCHIADKIINSPLDLFYFRKSWNRGLSIPPILFRSEGTKNVWTESSVFQACNCLFKKEQKWRNFYFIIFFSFKLLVWEKKKSLLCLAFLLTNP